MTRMTRTSRLAAILLGTIAAHGCSSIASDTQPLEPPGWVACPEPRPEVCTMEYDPVCGSLRDGDRRTFSNGCGACAEAQVVGYVPGECP